LYIKFRIFVSIKTGLNKKKKIFNYWNIALNVNGVIQRYYIFEVFSKKRQTNYSFLSGNIVEFFLRTVNNIKVLHLLLSAAAD